MKLKPTSHILLMIGFFTLLLLLPSCTHNPRSVESGVEVVERIGQAQHQDLWPLTAISCTKINKFSYEANFINCKRQLAQRAAKMGALVMVVHPERDVISGDRLPLSEFSNSKNSCKNCLQVRARLYGKLKGAKTTNEAIGMLVEETRE